MEKISFTKCIKIHKLAAFVHNFAEAAWYKKNVWCFKRDSDKWPLEQSSGK